MSLNKKYSSIFLWRIGYLLSFFSILFIPLLMAVLININDLYELIPTDANSGLFPGLPFVAIAVVTTWIYVSTQWKKWALKAVKTADYNDLIRRINDKENSFILKGWNELSSKSKGYRIIGLLIFSGAFYAFDYMNAKTHQQLNAEGIYTEATVLSITQKAKNKKKYIIANITFNVGDTAYEDEHVLSTGFFNRIEETNGFLIQKGDAYQILYAASDPMLNRLMMDSPSAETVSRLMEVTQNKLVKDGQDSILSKCMVQATYQTFGFKGIAQLYHRNTSYWKNENYNSIKYRLMTEKPEFTTIIEACN